MAAAIRKGGTKEFELLHARIEMIDAARSSDSELLESVQGDSCSAIRLYNLHSRKLLDETELCNLLIAAAKREDIRIPVTNLISLAMRFNNKANYIKFLDAIRPLSAKTEGWLRRCDAYKYGGETIAQIRTAIGARPKFQIDAPVSTREDLRALMSLKDERFQKAYANSALYYRGLESSFFGAHFILDGSLNEDALDWALLRNSRLRHDSPFPR